MNNDKELITKKELLIETGISYGQLYRWKREGVIPDEWFIKRSSFTGQETYFKRQQILERIEIVKELRSKYSLEDLSKILSPDISEKIFLIDELKKIDEISSSILDNIKEVYGKRDFSMKEIVVFICISKLQRECALDTKQTSNILSDIKSCIADINNLDFKMIIVKLSDRLGTILYSYDKEIVISSELSILASYNLKEISEAIILKYRKERLHYFNNE
jgi:DNA-binding transcriptional MerR regulator